MDAFDMMEYPFITISQFPAAFIYHLGTLWLWKIGCVINILPWSGVNSLLYSQNSLGWNAMLWAMHLFVFGVRADFESSIPVVFDLHYIITSW